MFGNCTIVMGEKYSFYQKNWHIQGKRDLMAATYFQMIQENNEYIHRERKTINEKVSWTK